MTDLYTPVNRPLQPLTNRTGPAHWSGHYRRPSAAGSLETIPSCYTAPPTHSDSASLEQRQGRIHSSSLVIPHSSSFPSSSRSEPNWQLLLSLTTTPSSLHTSPTDSLSASNLLLFARSLASFESSPFVLPACVPLGSRFSLSLEPAGRPRPLFFGSAPEGLSVLVSCGVGGWGERWGEGAQTKGLSCAVLAPGVRCEAGAYPGGMGYTVVAGGAVVCTAFPAYGRGVCWARV